ncbi:DUF4145 domain-containing protein [Bacillus sp. CRN 9]|nr:DUF4145 domain-containing protein [Bacillus sp. CRN 9]
MDHLKPVRLRYANSTSFNGKETHLPRFCPHCSQAISAILIEGHLTNYYNDIRLGVITHRCPDCNKHFITVHEKSGDSLSYVTHYPNTRKIKFHEMIEEKFPRFVNIYNQAYSAEQQNHLDVAGAGYRMSLEVLIKDFAIKELKKDSNEVIKLSLAKALEKYLDDQDALTSADVVRVLGNDYAHYEQKHSEVGFKELKWYLDVFIKRIEAKILLLNPPVRTRQLAEEIE